jgi:TPR repeat protein
MNMKHKTMLLSAALALLFSATASASASATTSADHEYEVGLAAAMDYRYSEALVQFRLAATQGNLDAQRTIGLMLLYGDRLYGADVHRNDDEAIHWLKLAKTSGDETSAFVLEKLARRGK